MIINPVSGGGTQLAYSWVNAASYGALPGSPPAGTFGFITSITVGAVYPTNEDLTGLVEGDVVLRHGAHSNARINILKTGRLDLYPSGAYQYQSGLLVPIDSYLHDGSAWKRVYVLFYKNNTFPAIVGGNFAAHKTSSGGTLTLTKNADHMALAFSSARGWCTSVSPVDLTNMSSIGFFGSGSHLSVVTNFNIHTNYTDTSFTSSVSLPVNNQHNWVFMDVSARTGSFYLRFGITSTDASLTVRCYEWYGLG